MNADERRFSLKIFCISLIITSDLHPAIRAWISVATFEHKVKDPGQQEKATQKQTDKNAAPCLFFSRPAVTAPIIRANYIHFTSPKLILLSTFSFFKRLMFSDVSLIQIQEAVRWKEHITPGLLTFKKSTISRKLAVFWPLRPTTSFLRCFLLCYGVSNCNYGLSR